MVEQPQISWEGRNRSVKTTYVEDRVIKMTAPRGSANLIIALSVFVLNMLKNGLRGNVTTNQIDAIYKTVISNVTMRVS